MAAQGVELAPRGTIRDKLMVASVCRSELEKMTALQTAVIGIGLASRIDDPEKYLDAVREIFSNYEELVIPMAPDERAAREEAKRARLDRDIDLLKKVDSY